MEPGTSFRIGGDDSESEGTWVFQDGSPMVYQNFHSSEPDNLGGVEHYNLMIHRYGKWRWGDDSYDGEKSALMCEMGKQKSKSS